MLVIMHRKRYCTMIHIKTLFFKGLIRDVDAFLVATGISILISNAAASFGILNLVQRSTNIVKLTVHRNYF